MEASKGPLAANPGIGLAGRPRKAGISLIVLAHNDQHTVGRVLRAADQALSQLATHYEIVVVDDGSTDGTVSAAQATGQILRTVRVVVHEKHLGCGAALRKGLQVSTHPEVGYLSADGRYDPAELARLSMVSPPYDLACGYRGERRDAGVYRILSLCYRWLANFLLGTRVRDPNCEMKLGRRAAIQQLGLESNSEFVHAELLARARMQQLTVAEVPVTEYPARAREGRGLLRKSFTLMVELLRFWWARILFAGGGVEDVVKYDPHTGVRRWHVLALFGIAVALLFSRLTYPLIEPDEARYAQIAAHMLDTGDFLVPMREGMPYLDKPPLLYWLTAASYCVFGIHDFAARFVTALAGLGTFATVYFVGRRLVGRRGALLGAVLLLLSLGFVLSSRFLIMDGLLTLFTTSAMLAIYAATQRRELNKKWWLVAATACGLGLMTKGPVMLVLALPPLVAVRWLAPRTATIRFRDWLAFGTVMSVIAVPWFVAMTIRLPNFLNHFFWQHHVMRFTTNFAHGQPWWFYLPVLAIGLFPTCMLLPILWVHLFNRSPAVAQKRTLAQGYLLVAIAWVVVFFSLSTGKLAPYIMPAVPLVCLLLGAVLDKAMFSDVASQALATLRRSFPIHAARLCLIAAVIVGLVDGILDGWDPRQWTDSVLLILGAVLLFRYVSRPSFANRPARWLAAAAIPLVVMAFGLIDIYPDIATHRSVASHVALFRNEYQEPLPVVVYGRYEDSLLFYNRDAPPRSFGLGQTDDLIAYLAANPRVLLVAPQEFAATLRQRLPATTQLEDQSGARGYLHLAVSPGASPDALARPVTASAPAAPQR